MSAGVDYAALVADIRAWGRALGFASVGIADCALGEAESRLAEWLARGWHGEMEYMARHGARRARPAELVPGTLRVIVCRIDYTQGDGGDGWAAEWAALADGERAVVSLYARGRDYHKVMRARLARLAAHIAARIGPFAHRAFADSAPVMETELAAKAGIGWRGKHTLVLRRDAGSMFFLGELYVALPLPVDTAQDDHCGSCTRCLDVCPTRAIRAPYRLDARRCISYLTIELAGDIPEELRPAIGNRIYGCDDCQLVCPWNRHAQKAVLPDFEARHGLGRTTLVELFAWSEAVFLARTEGSAIRRIGHARWLRNIAVALGNAPPSVAARAALAARADHPSALVRRHVAWALARQSA